MTDQILLSIIGLTAGLLVGALLLQALFRSSED